MDREHIELVKQHGDGLAETIQGLDHTARYDLMYLSGTWRYTAKTAGPIQMPFGTWAQLGLSNHVLDGVPDPLGEGTMGPSHICNRRCTHSRSVSCLCHKHKTVCKLSLIHI